MDWAGHTRNWVVIAQNVVFSDDAKPVILSLCIV